MSTFLTASRRCGRLGGGSRDGPVMPRGSASRAASPAAGAGSPGGCSRVMRPLAPHVVLAGGALGTDPRPTSCPVWPETAQLLAGFGRMPLRTYAAGLTLAALPWAVVDATIGSALVAAFTSGWGAAVVGAVAAYLIWRHRDRLMGRGGPDGRLTGASVPARENGLVFSGPPQLAFAALPKWQMFVAFWAVGVLRGLGYYVVGALVGTRLHDARWSEARARSRRSARVRWSSPGRFYGLAGATQVINGAVRVPIAHFLAALDATCWPVGRASDHRRRGPHRGTS